MKRKKWRKRGLEEEEKNRGMQDRRENERNDKETLTSASQCSHHLPPKYCRALSWPPGMIPTDQELTI